MATVASRSGGAVGMRKKTAVPGVPVLPAPLTDEIMAAAIRELPDGTRRATEACLKCFKERKFTAKDMTAFVHSIASQSQTLNAVLRSTPGAQAARGKTAGVASKVPTTSSAKVPFGGGGATRPAQRAPPSEQAIEDTKFEKTEQAVDMTSKLIERRRREVLRRQLAAFPGSQHQKYSQYVASVIRRLADQVPPQGKAALLDAMRSYVAHTTTPEQFVESVRTIVDDCGITIPLEYSPEHETRAQQPQGNHSNKRGSQQPSQASRKRARAEAASAASAAAALPVINIDSSPSPTSSSSYAATPMADAGSDTAWSPREGAGFAPSCHEGPVSSRELNQTALGDFLTLRAGQESLAERNVQVKVVSQTMQQAGGEAGGCYRVKSIFAFQQLDAQGEVMLLGMYVHEFGPEAPPETRGRVLIECIDSIPIHGNERSEERQKLLTGILMGYIEYVRGQGFSHIHLRVPPPSAENHHVFTARSLSVRLEATVRMAHWYRRLMETAQSKGLVHSFDLNSHLSKMATFPPSVLPSSDLAEEHAFATMRSQLSRSIQSGERSEVDVKLFQKLISFKDRFCVASLHDPASHAPPLLADQTPNFATNISAKRLTFVLACKRESLCFGSLSDAKMSTMLLLARMISDQRGAGAQLDPPACSAGGAGAGSRRLGESDMDAEPLVAEFHEHQHAGDGRNQARDGHHHHGHHHGMGEMQHGMQHGGPSWSADGAGDFGMGEGRRNATFDCQSAMGAADIGGWEGAEMCETVGGVEDAELFADSLLSM
uniref:histone acetyltransferase n=1 Tax=Hemiselmis tepida TaxID=464990 RepID=A0A7S0V9A0_9CRYP|mmetsp:Transcript_11328/g.29439  ORF Transcript_11328/g.29439 Transcript_11328/m.29439 type:complete len:773 (+) Transcript_11328:173-2491(+)